MKGFLGVTVLSLLLLVGCSTSLTQNDCMTNGERFKYMEKCVEMDDIPEEDQKEVWLEVASEIAEAQDITIEEALVLMNQIMDGYSEDN